MLGRNGLAVLTAALLALLITAPAHAADRLYWGNEFGGGLRFSNLDGSGGEDVNTGAATNRFPVGLAIDPAGARIYWVGLLGKTISFANLDGSGGGDLAIGDAVVNEPHGAAIDPVSRRIYWANSRVRTISFANLDGSGGGNLMLPGGIASGFPTGVAIDPTARRVYWVQGGGLDAERISFLNLDGSGGGAVNTAGTTGAAPEGLAIDPVQGRVYWADAGVGKISFANLDGSGGGQLNTTGASVRTPAGVAIDPVARRIYWANSGGPLSFANLDGSGGGDIPTGVVGDVDPRYPVLLLAPRPSVPPAIGGGSRLGSALDCSRGDWAGDVVEAFFYRAPHAFRFQWSRDGRDIPGATGSSLSAAQAGEYRCRVTAENAAGTAAQTSQPHRVSPAGFGKRTRITIALAARRVPASGPLPIRIGNANPFAVAGKLSGKTSKLAASGDRRGIKLRAKAFRLGANRRAIVKLKLPKPLRLALARKRKLSFALRATVADSVGTKRTVRKTVVPKLRA